MKRIHLLTMLLLLVASIGAWGAPLKNLPMAVTQPDGTTLNIFASGDEFHNWLHDANGYTIIQHPKTGYYVYALQDGDYVKASDLIVGQAKPSSIGITPNVNINSLQVDKKRKEHAKSLPLPQQITKGEFSIETKGRAKSNKLSNIVVFIQFSDENITNEPISFYNNIFNNETQASVYNYYKEVTNGKLAISSTFLPQTSTQNVVWFKDSNPRNFYRPFNQSTNTIGYDPDATSGSTNRTVREHLLLKNAIEAVSSQLPADFEVDSNGDGYVDCVCFIVSGGPDGWNQLLWPHMWVLYSHEVFIKGKQVWDYTFQLQYSSGVTPIQLGTLAHEMFHVVGAPDLYRYEDRTVTPTGIWDLMASTGNNPQQMTTYMKYAYGEWIDEIPTITQSGTYQINPSYASSNTCFKIPSDKSHSEFFMVEYRNNSYTYDNVLPGSGLLVYRINDYYAGEGNAYGPPDELYIYRPTAGLNSAFFSQASGRTAINSTTNPSPLLSNDEQGGLKIHSIGNPGQTMSFSVDIDYAFPSVLKYYKPKGKYAIGTGAAKDFHAAIKFTAADLTTHVGKFFTKIEIFVNEDAGTDVTAMVWEGTENGSPKTVIYEKSISSQVVPGQWVTHKLSESIEIKANTDYWIGFFMKSTGGHQLALDNGPLVDGKGGWLKWTDSWIQVVNLSTSIDLNKNLLISAVVNKDALPSSTPKPENIIGSGLRSFPNPFSQSTTIAYSLDKACMVNMAVYNALGQQVALLVNDTKPFGEHRVEFNASNLPSGVYFYKLSLDNGIGGSITNRMVISR